MRDPEACMQESNETLLGEGGKSLQYIAFALHASNFPENSTCRGHIGP